MDNKLILNLKETQDGSYRTDGKLKRMEACIVTAPYTKYCRFTLEKVSFLRLVGLGILIIGIVPSVC